MYGKMFTFTTDDIVVENVILYDFVNHTAFPFRKPYLFLKVHKVTCMDVSHSVCIHVVA